jgi:DNA-binding transcriptional LysR family regulator
MFEWDDARHFLAVHRKGSLSAAARQLGVNQSTVGRRLASLEEQLGAKLFMRTRDGLQIAPAGERLLPHAERMEEEAMAIAREIAGQEATLSGVVRVTAPDFFGTRVVAPLLATFHARYPDIDLELDADIRMRSLTRREADVAVRVGGGGREPGLVVRKVSDLALALYASEKYIAVRGRPYDGDYTEHDFIGYSAPFLHSTDARWIEEQAERASGARIVMRSHATAVQRRMALEGVGLALLPCYLGDAEPGLVQVLPPSQAPTESVYLVVHEDLREAARIRACATFLADGIRAAGPVLRGEVGADQLRSRSA